jgi:hypothetical protein
MRTLLVVVVLLAVGIAGYGFYRGWFQLSTNSADQKPSATFTMDKDKIHADEERVKEFAHGAKEKPGHQTDKVKQ